MDILEEFRWQAENGFAWLESIVRDVTSEQALWQPPGCANSIAATYAHIVRNADEDLNQRLFRRPRLNEGVWKGRTGLPGDGNEFEAGSEIDWEALRAYGRAVAAFVLETVAAMNEFDLTVPADLSTPDIARWDGRDIVRLTVGHHLRMHGGEIACLKGLQGERGYVGGLDTEET